MSKGHEFETRCREWVEKRARGWKVDPKEAVALEKIEYARGSELEAEQHGVLRSLANESLELTDCAAAVNASPSSVQNWAERALQRGALAEPQEIKHL